MADQQQPKTPERDDEQRDDESFKTCPKFVPSPKTRRQLRMTPARNSILTGGTPFKEATPTGKKFNSRKKSARKLNDTGGSNETFIRHEEELLFERDSLNSTKKMSSTPKHFTSHSPLTTPTDKQPLELAQIKETSPIKPLDAEPSRSLAAAAAAVATAAPVTKPLSPRKSARKSTAASDRNQQQQVKIAKKKSPSPKKVAKRAARMPPPPVPSATVTARSENRKQNFNRFVTPRTNVFRKPAPPPPSSARSGLSLWNSSRLTRTQSYKSTAELERDYFNSLRSRF